MKIAIWGKKKEAVYLMKQIGQEKESTVVCFINNNIDELHNAIDGLPICSFEQFKKMYAKTVDAVVLAVRNGYSINCILKQLAEINDKKIGLMKLAAYDFGKKVEMINEANSQIFWLDRESKLLFPYFQIILIKTCNLNCKGCTHFANLFNKQIEEDNVYPIQNYEKDLRILSQYVNVFRLRLLGGEPLLYPYLGEAIKIAKQNFPLSDIRIVTNGLLIPQMSDELLSIIKENNIGIDISPYKPTIKIKEKIIFKLEQFDIDYCFEGYEDEYIREFSKNISIYKENDKEKAVQNCFALQCQTLLNGKIYKCPFEALGYKFFKYFGVKSDVVNWGYDIRNDNINWNNMVDNLKSNPVNACKYCSDKIESFKWKIENNPQIIDWTVKTDD